MNSNETARLPINDAAEHAAVQNVVGFAAKFYRLRRSCARGNTFHGGITVTRHQGSKGKLFLLP